MNGVDRKRKRARRGERETGGVAGKLGAGPGGRPEGALITPGAWLAALIPLVALIVLATHWPGLSARAILKDDVQYVTKNVLVQNPSWASAGRFFSEVLEPSTVRGYYQPLTMISLMLDHALGGRPDDLRAFHCTSLGLHVLNTALVIVLLYLLFGQPVPAALAGLLFGVHPLTVESVTWLSDRKTLLATCFALWCLILYVHATRKGTWWPYGVSLVMYILALLSKPTTVPLPVLLLLLDYWPLRRLGRRAVVEKAPFLALSLAFALITFISQSRTAPVTVPGESELARIPLIVCHNVIFYLYKMFWPANLTPHYGFPDPLALRHPMVLAGVIGTCLLIPALLLSWRWTRGPLVGWLFFFVAIFPTLGVVGFTDVIAADRFVYLPALGPLLVITWLLARVWVDRAGVWRRRLPTVAMVVVVVLVAAAEATATRRYLSYWQDMEKLHRRMVALAPQAPETHYNLGVVMAKQGNLAEAIRSFSQAIRIRPSYAEAHYNLGVALLTGQIADIDRAMAHFAAAIQIRPHYRAAHKNLAAALVQKGRSGEAIGHYTEALWLQPDDYSAHYGLAVALAMAGRDAEAIAEYREVLRLRPDHAEARRRLTALEKQAPP